MQKILVTIVGSFCWYVLGIKLKAYDPRDKRQGGSTNFDVMD